LKIKFDEAKRKFDEAIAVVKEKLKTGQVILDEDRSNVLSALKELHPEWWANEKEEKDE